MTGARDIWNDAAFLSLYRHDACAFVRDRLGFDPNPRQRLVLEALHGDGILCCHRQWGKSTVVAAKVVHLAVVKPGSEVIVCAPAVRQANELFRKIRAFAGKLNTPRRSDGFNPLSLVFPNQSRVVAVPTDKDKARGFTSVSMIVVDEASRVQDEAYFSLTPMLARSGGVSWLLSTPNGRSGFFYDAWTSGGPGWTRVFSTVDDTPEISREFLDKERRSKPDSEFLQDFYCVFQDTAAQIFDTGDVLHALSDAVTPLFRPNPHVRGTMQVSYFIGLDLGQKRDYTAIAVLEWHQYNTGELDPVSAQWRIASTLRLRWLERVPLHTAYTDVVNRLRNLLSQYPLKGESTLVVDATGPGAPVVDFIRAARLGASLIPVSITGGEAAHYTNGAYHVPKRALLSILQILFQNRTLEIASCLELADRLRVELTDMRPSSEHHGDLAMALALAAWQVHQRRLRPAES